MCRVDVCEKVSVCLSVFNSVTNCQTEISFQTITVSGTPGVIS